MSLKKITLQTISAHPSKITGLVAEPRFDALPFRPYAEGSNHDALVASVGSALDYTAAHPDMPLRVMNATTFYNAVNENTHAGTQDWWPFQDDDFLLLTFATRGDKKPACMLMVSPGMKASFSREAAAAEFSADYGISCSLSPSIFSDDNSTPKGVLMRNGNEFNNKFSNVANIAQDGQIVWQPQYHVAAIKNETARALRAELFPNAAHVIEDITYKEFITRPGANRDRCVNDGSFLRLTHPPSQFRKTKEHLYTMVPWYSAMFLNTDQDGFIFSVKTSNSLSQEFTTSTLIQTDYRHLNITLVPVQTREKGRKPRMALAHHQQRILERALRDGITLQNQHFKAVDSGAIDIKPPETRMYPTVYDGHADISTSLRRDGTLNSTNIVLGGAQHLEALAVRRAETVVIRAAGQNFHFIPA